MYSSLLRSTHHAISTRSTRTGPSGRRSSSPTPRVSTLDRLAGRLLVVGADPPVLRVHRGRLGGRRLLARRRPRASGTRMSDPEDAVAVAGRGRDLARLQARPGVPARCCENTRPVRDLDVDAYDALVVAGGQGPMFTFERRRPTCSEKFVAFYETGKVTAALCHGTAILAFATLSDGEPLVQGQDRHRLPERRGGRGRPDDLGRRRAARGQHIMPWRIEDALRALGANYIQAGRVPLVRHPRRQPRHRPAELLRRRGGAARSSRRSGD